MSIMDKFSLDGKVCIVTGGERGIGRAISFGFIEAGGKVFIFGQDETAAEELRSMVSEPSRQPVFYKADVTSEDEVKAAVNSVLEKEGRINVLVNNVGMSKHADAEKMPLAMWEKVLSVNMTSQFIVSREVGNVMIAQHAGSIIQIASMSAFIVNRPITQCNYNASKAGVVQLAKSLAAEWAQYGVRVNVIAPGYMHTPITEHRLLNPDDEAVPIWLGMTPMKRVGEPEEIAGAAVYFASDASTFTTGAVLNIDGGYTCW